MYGQVLTWVVGFLNSLFGINPTGGGTQFGASNTAKVGFYGVTPVVQPASTGELIGFNGNGATNANAVNFNANGNLGATSYSLGDLVKALKQEGLIKQ